VLLENKTAVVNGGGGRIGGAVARTFTKVGVRVIVAGRTLTTLQQGTDEIAAAGCTAEIPQVWQRNRGERWLPMC
jgi:NADP-dependent 3-hydroxy acid dehydrogenase YdfG